MARTTAGPRRRAREVAFRVAYQAGVTGDSGAAVWEALRDQERLSEDQVELVRDIVRALTARLADIDGAIQQAAEHWPLDRLSQTDRAALRAAVAELLTRPGTPARVVLDETIEVARRFGSEDSARFVNGVLDRIARTLRPGELE